MPVFKVSGSERASANVVTWYLDAGSRREALAHAADSGLTNVEADEVNPVPPGVEVITVEIGPRAGGTFQPRLFWTIVFAIIAGNLATAAILKLINSL